MFNFIIQCCFVVVSLLWSQSAWAFCNLQINSLANNQTVVVDAGDIGTTDVTTTVTFNVENTGTSSCYYFLTMDDGGFGIMEYNRFANITHALPELFRHSNTDAISYQLYSQSVTANDIVKTLDDAQFNQNVVGPQEILAGQTLLESFIIHVPAQTLPNLIAESYEDAILFTLYENSNAVIDIGNDCPTCTEVSSFSMTFQFDITDYATLSIGDQYDLNAKQAEIDFGQLYTNKQEFFTIYVGGRTASGTVCTVTMSSENGSKLVRLIPSHLGAPQSHDEIDYSVTATSYMGGPNVSPTIDLSSPNTPVTIATSSMPFVCGNNNQGVMGIDVTITIGTVDTSTLFGGTFQDIITVEATIGL